MQLCERTIQDRNGNALSGVSVAVTTYPAGVAATIYDANGAAIVGNTLTTDANGYIAFRAANGSYTLTLSGALLSASRTIIDVQLHDPDDTVTFAGDMTVQGSLSVLEDVTVQGRVQVTGRNNAFGNTVTALQNLTGSEGASGHYVAVQYTTGGTYFVRGCDVMAHVRVDDAITNSGFVIGHRVEVLRNANATVGEGNGTIEQLYGALLAVGNLNVAPGATPVVNNATGVNVGLYSQTGTVGNAVGVIVGQTTGGTCNSAVAFYASDLSATTAIGFRSEVSAGSGKWNVYANGTAANYLNGKLLIGSSTDQSASKLEVAGDSIQIRTAKTPASAADTGVTGQIAWDADYIYVCIATNTWRRVAHATW